VVAAAARLSEAGEQLLAVSGHGHQDGVGERGIRPDFGHVRVVVDHEHPQPHFAIVCHFSG
jgi:hypothetical protein